MALPLAAAALDALRLNRASCAAAAPSRAPARASATAAAAAAVAASTLAPRTARLLPLLQPAPFFLSSSSFSAARSTSFPSTSRLLLLPRATPSPLHAMSTAAADTPAAATTTPAPASPVPSTPPIAVRDTITLSPAERELFDTLLAAVRHAGAATVLRCAGGWVRDKLLGRDSDDIDVALDDRMGRDFADLVNAYLQAQGRESRHAAVIQSNPDQSKHLETARMKIGGVWIDLVNLRSETYAADSRIPTATFGTPQQDALRRDFTINALFYNVSEGGVVEDFTGRGLQDLRDGLIRTPLPPMETFLDDPLRVLRAVRFGTRFGFRLHPDILEAAASEQVRVALGTKISRERVGTELEGMVQGPDPVAAARLLHALGLFPAVFTLPPPLDVRLGEAYGGPCVRTLAAADELARSLGLQLDKEERRFLVLAALLLPLRRLQHTPAKGKPVPATSAIIRDSLKWRVKDIDMTAALHEAAEMLAAAYGALLSGDGDGNDGSGGGGGGGAGAGGGEAPAATDVRVTLGHAIRRLKQHWRLGVVLAPVLRMRDAAPLGTDAAAALDGGGNGAGGGAITAAAAGGTPGGGGGGASSGGSSADGGAPAEVAEAEAGARLEVARQLLAAVEAYGLSECWTWKPLLDGKKVQALLGWTKPGPELGRVMAAVSDWQLMYPAGSAAEAEAMVRARFGGAK